MEKKAYLALDIYSKSELQDALSFAPRLGWSLHSIQDVFSRSDAGHFSLSKKDRVSYSTNSLSGLTFDEYVHGKAPASGNNDRTETHITSYSKVVFERDNYYRSKEDLIIENNYVNLVKLENKIFEIGNNQDYSYVNEEKKRGNGVFVIGLIFLSLALAFWIFDLSLASSSITSSTSGSLGIMKNVSFFGAVILSALGLLFFLPSFFALVSAAHAERKAKKNRKMWAEDYAKVVSLKHDFERMYIEGKKPRLNKSYYKLMCRKYGFSYYKIRYKQAR